ncbi:MAG: hypothetical protein ACWGON_02205 [Gemmatimonadota bacterium]
MSSFEYVMVLVSIVIGLAITHILTALASAIHRLQGHGEPLRLDPVYLLWIGYVLTWLVSFWWWEFKFQELADEWSFGLYLFIIMYAVSLFLLAAILVPHRMAGIRDSYQYFMEGRRWFFGASLVAIGMDVIDSFLKSAEWGMRPEFLVQTTFFASAAIVGIVSNRRSVQLGAAIVAFAVQLIYMFSEVGVLGSW